MGFKEDEVITRINNALMDVDMQEYAKKSIHNLSFKQKKRICIAAFWQWGMRYRCLTSLQPD